MAQVRFFAGAAEAASTDQTTLDIPHDADVGWLRTALISRHPGLQPVLPSCALLVDGVSRIDDAELLGTANTVDVLPPFAGG